MSETVVAVHDLGHVYLAGTPMAAVGLSSARLAVRRGEIAVVVGPDGAGKSTLLRFLNGLLRPSTKGHVQVLGHDIASPDLDLPQLRRRVGLVMQYPHHQLFEHYVGDDIAYGPRQLALSAGEVRERVRWAMACVGLDFEGFKDRTTFSLSSGEMRRAALAGVLAMQPELLVLDEATTGLDPEGRRQVHALLRRMRDEQGITIVFASNDMDQVCELADTVTVLQGGRTVLQEPTAEAFWRLDNMVPLGLCDPVAVGIARGLRAGGLNIVGRPISAIQVEEAIWRATQG